MKTLMELPTDQGATLMTGLSPALLPHEALFWRDGFNILFRDAGVRSIPGSSVLSQDARIPPAAALLQLRQAFSTNIVLGGPQLPYFNNYIIFGSAAKLYLLQSATSPTPALVIPPFLSVNQNPEDPMAPVDFTGGDWSFTSFGNAICAANGVDIAVYGLSTGGFINGFAELPTGHKPRILRRLGPRIIVFGYDGDKGQDTLWCSADDLTDWDITSPTNSAGELFLRDLNGDIVAVEPLNAALAVYTENAMGLFSDIGAPLIFGFKLYLRGIGAIGKNAVVSAGDRNFGLGRAGIWETDGVSYNYIDDPMVKKYLQDNVNWAAAPRLVSSFHLESENLVIFSYPTGAAEYNTECVLYNYRTLQWSKLNFGMHAGSGKQIFANAVYLTGLFPTRLDIWGTEADAGQLCSITSKPLDFGTDDVLKRVQNIRMGISGNARIYLGAQEKLDDPIEWYYDFPASAHPDIPDREMTYLTIRVEGTNFYFSGLKIRGEVVGAFV